MDRLSRTTASFCLLALASTAALAECHRSHFGFGFKLDDIGVVRSPGETARTFGEPVRIARCETATLDDQRYAVIEYTVPSRGLTVLQYALPWTAGHRLLVVGGWKVHGAERVRAAQEQIAKAILRDVPAPAAAGSR